MSAYHVTVWGPRDHYVTPVTIAHCPRPPKPPSDLPIVDYPPVEDTGDWIWIANAERNSSGLARCLCRCKCGVEKLVIRANLVNKVSRGCGACRTRDSWEGRRRADRVR